MVGITYDDPKELPTGEAFNEIYADFLELFFDPGGGCLRVIREGNRHWSFAARKSI